MMAISSPSCHQSGGDVVERGFPIAICGCRRFHHRIGEAELAVHEMEVETALSHIQVEFTALFSARCLAVIVSLRAPDLHVATAVHSRCRCCLFREEPHALLKTEVGAGQSADGADIDRVERVVVLNRLPGCTARVVWLPRSVKPSTGSVGDLRGEADAAASRYDAALVIEAHPRADIIDILRLLDLVPRRSGFFALPCSTLNSCRAAFASLVADGAVERVIDEEELHHALCGIPA